MDPSIDDEEDEEALERIGMLIDRANDHADTSLADQALTLADVLEARGLPDASLALLDYFRANAWACRAAERAATRDGRWEWEQPEMRQQLYLLRRALNNAAFDDLHPLHGCQILTNLANQLDTLGRFVEARALWTRALSVEARFWMARGNRGVGLIHYADALYDRGHASVLALHAHDDLTRTVELIGIYPLLGDPALASLFEDHASRIARSVDLDAVRADHDPDDRHLGDTPDERSYRRWCLTNTLFLNPFNDVGAEPVAARDILGLPSFTTGFGEPPIVIGMANELKQGYASARWLLWDGTNAGDVHFSDRGVLLYNTLDYPAYGFAVEKVKLAFRMAYSTLDKIAFLLNHYLNLGVPVKKVSFRTIWRDKENGPVRAAFATSENWPWRGLFWLAKDLFEEGLREATDPDARSLAELRNHLEHKYVKVHDMSPPRGRADDPLFDTLAHAISRTDLERRTLKLMQLVRAALIYLFLGMHRQEGRREPSEYTLYAARSVAGLLEAIVLPTRCRV